jgi:hypothetical protein
MFGKLLLTVLPWSLLVAIGMSADVPQADYVKVEIRGTLKTGVIVIGGETTGYVVEAGGSKWELDFGNNAELKKLADGLDGKTVVVTGSYGKRAGVEVPERHIVTVATLAAAK